MKYTLIVNGLLVVALGMTEYCLAETLSITAPKASLSDRIKSGLSSTGAKISSGFKTIGTKVGSGANKLASGIKSGTKSVLKITDKVSNAIQPFADKAFSLGELALQGRQANDADKRALQGRQEEHRLAQLAADSAHRQELEITRLKQEHEFKLREMEINLERMKLMRNPEAVAEITKQRDEAIENFDNLMENMQN